MGCLSVAAIIRAPTRRFPGGSTALTAAPYHEPMMIVLQDGETLRIRGEFVLSVSRTAGGGSTWEIVEKPRGYLARAGRAVLAWWLRMHRLVAAAGRRLARANFEHAQ